MQSQSIREVDHYVFEDKDEFTSFFQENGTPVPKLVKDWRHAYEGDWVISDDGRIVQILKRGKIRHPQDRKNYRYYKAYVRTIVGTFLCRDNVYMDTDFSEHPNRYMFSKSGKTSSQRFNERKELTKKEKIFATNIVAGFGMANSYIDAYSETDPYKAKRKAAVLLKQERIMKEIERSVVDVAKGMGITHDWVLEKLKQLAEEGGNDHIKLNAVKEVGKAIGTTGGITVKERSTGVIGLFQGFEPAQIEGAKRPLVIEEKKEISHEK